MFLGFATAALLGPIPQDVELRLTPQRPAAVLSGDIAVFAFPLDSLEHFAPTREDTLRGDALVDFLWEVTWDVPYDRLGIDSHGVQSRSPTLELASPRRGSLLSVPDSVMLFWRGPGQWRGDLVVPVEESP
jgi:hypothetical protein